MSLALEQNRAVEMLPPMEAQAAEFRQQILDRALQLRKEARGRGERYNLADMVREARGQFPPEMASVFRSVVADVLAIEKAERRVAALEIKQSLAQPMVDGMAA